jgi:hypothetical protein
MSDSPVDHPNIDKVKDAITDAQWGAVMMLPHSTIIGVILLIDNNVYLKLLGIPVTVGGLVIDTLKLVPAAVFSVGSLVRAGWFWVRALKSPSIASPKS